jgi:hypothetical protein
MRRYTDAADSIATELFFQGSVTSPGKLFNPEIAGKKRSVRMNRKPGMSFGKVLWGVSVGLILAIVSSSPANAASITEGLDSLFTDLKSSFDKTASSKTLRSTKISPVNGFFIRTLKANQVIYSMLRTNSKGTVINEVIRGEDPLTKKRDISTQPWFRAVVKKSEPYTGFLKEENGRYYLFWVAPITSSTGKLLGTVAAKVDIWDCIHKFSGRTETPFLVRVEKLSLYSHKWKGDMAYLEEPLAVPGVDKITVRYMSGAAQASVPAIDSAALLQARQDSLRVAAGQDSIKAALATQQKARNKVMIGIGIGVAGLLLFIIVRLVMWFRHMALLRRVEQDF